MTSDATAAPMTTVTNLEEIPPFGSEREEAKYWQTHELSEELWKTLPPVPEEELPPARPQTRSVAIHFDESTLRRLKALAACRRKGYQTLLSAP